MILNEWRELIKDAPSAPGLYMVWKDEQSIYVGTSDCISRRLEMHSHMRKFLEQSVTSVTFILTAPAGHVETKPERFARYDMELALIRKHKPSLNGKGGKPRRAKTTIII